MKQRLAGLVTALRVPEIRRRIFFVMWMFAVYVACAHVPLPGVDKEAIDRLFQRGAGLGDILDTFAGGSLRRFSVLALGIMPYINASIIFQLLVMAVPALEKISKEEDGPKKIAQWTKYWTIPLAALQAAGMIGWFGGMGAFTGGLGVRLFDIAMMTSGTMFLMWLGEMISERGIGQGISLIIFAGIMTRMPTDVARTIMLWRGGEFGLTNIVFLLVFFLATVYLIVLVQQAQRKIPVQYAKRIRGGKIYGGGSTFLPLRVNQAGVIPIIFAISVAMFPATLAQLFGSPAMIQAISRLGVSENVVRNAILSIVEYTTPGANFFATALYFVLVVVFTYFYTAVTFNPEQIAENLQKNGGAIPGIRPGERTRDYLDRILYRITLIGAIFLGFIAVIEFYVGPITGVTTFTLVGGTSLLIVVGVALDTMQQIEAQLLMRHMRGFLV
ncbi:MAG: preprotein translocase subunit SecY [Armatimonadetes bacterium]|nr:preprotein translocase subunit SecY [Armatimonadota bacterium]